MRIIEGEEKELARSFKEERLGFNVAQYEEEFKNLLCIAAEQRNGDVIQLFSQSWR